MKLYTALGRFQEKMEGEFIRKDRAGWIGWDEIDADNVKYRLLDNAKRGDWVDVANLAMLLWYKSWKEADHEPK
jgi:hypothetical protein